LKAVLRIAFDVSESDHHEYVLKLIIILDAHHKRALRSLLSRQSKIALAEALILLEVVGRYDNALFRQSRAEFISE